jgi:hypothetical protein
MPGKRRVIREKTKTRRWKDYSKQKLQDYVGLQLSYKTLPSDPDALDLFITDILKDAIDKLCPLRVIRTARSEDLVSNEVERIKKK